MSIGVRIGIAVLATVFSVLTATTGVEEVFAFGAPVPATAAGQRKRKRQRKRRHRQQRLRATSWK